MGVLGTSGLGKGVAGVSQKSDQALPDQISDLRCYIAEGDSSHALPIALRSRFKTLFTVPHEVPLCLDTYMLHVICTPLMLLFQILVSVEILCTTCERID